MSVATLPKKNQMMDYCKIKLLFLILGVLVIGIDMKADSEMRSHNVYVDLFDSSNIVSVNYDTRFGGSSVFGWRAGMGYSLSRFEGYKGWLGNYREGISLPLGINALFGKRASKFEVGVGLTPGIYSYRDSRLVIGENYQGNEDFGPESWRGSCALGLDLGYRLQRKKGFLFRAGISPCLDINSDMISFNFLSLYPYLSFGYTFK